ncbi:STAS domain protein [Ancylostoma caninum]|uniref:STAS domain protein n=1 Tax=Ancylostoma caninum TaxID=29170 RepID=A0A368EXP7_ANCCA|nr:STAS domain protein [Ancylostoma caninum]
MGKFLLQKARAAHKGAAREDRCRLVIDCGGFPYVDYLGLTTLKTVVADLIAANVQTFLVVQKGDMRKLFEVTDFYESVERERIFEKLDDAVRHAEERLLPVSYLHQQVFG